MAARFQVLLTKVRHIGAGQSYRDERTNPEQVLEAFTTETADQAEALFRSLCALGSVRLGRQRAKVIALAGTDINQNVASAAVPVVAGPRWLDLAGAR